MTKWFWNCCRRNFHNGWWLFAFYWFTFVLNICVAFRLLLIKPLKLLKGWGWNFWQFYDFWCSRRRCRCLLKAFRKLCKPIWEPWRSFCGRILFFYLKKFKNKIKIVWMTFMDENWGLESQGKFLVKISRIRTLFYYFFSLNLPKKLWS